MDGSKENMKTYYPLEDSRFREGIDERSSLKPLPTALIISIVYIIMIYLFREDGCAVIEVHDDGTGITEDMKEKIFDSYSHQKWMGTDWVFYP